MKEEEIIKKFRAKHWGIWLYRQFDILVPYLMFINATRQAFKKQGINGEFPIIFYAPPYWYGNKEMFAEAGKEAEHFLKTKDIFTLTKQCEAIQARGKVELNKLVKADAVPPLELYKQAIGLISPLNVYIWVAHAAEEYYKQVIGRAVEGYVVLADKEKFIGDISFPARANIYSVMEQEMRAGTGVEELYQKYSWIKSRTRQGFGPGFTREELAELQKEVQNKPEEMRFAPQVPEPLKPLAAELQELVYLRTLRTDALYELYFLAKPIFTKVEKYLNIESLQNYLPEEILSGKPGEKRENFAMLKYYDEVVITDAFTVVIEAASGEVKGTIAWKGVVRGRVKKIFGPEEADKVLPGDILLTNMTVPAYVAAMHRAAAFVTDEGGITCHAAILAREMKKPCITGTRIATRVLQDGDVVEVNANDGIVRKLK